MIDFEDVRALLGVAGGVAVAVVLLIGVLFMVGMGAGIVVDGYEVIR